MPPCSNRLKAVGCFPTVLWRFGGGVFFVNQIACPFLRPDRCDPWLEDEVDAQGTLKQLGESYKDATAKFGHVNSCAVQRLLLPHLALQRMGMR